MSSNYERKLNEWHNKCQQIILQHNVIQFQRQRKLIGAIASAVIAHNNTLIKKNKRHYSKKKIWISKLLEQRQVHGFYEAILPTLRLDDLRFQNYYRMNTTQFEELLQIVGPRIARQYAVREPINAEQRLSICLRYLASGDSMTSMMYQYLVSLTSITNIISETCEVLWEMLSPIVLKPPTESDWREIANQFNEKWNFPNCIGAIDGKHVVIQSPNHSGSMYFNYKKNHSIVLLAMCDANYMFTVVDIGAYGRQSDGGIFKHSRIGQRFSLGQMNVPPPSEIYEGSGNYPYVLVGDEAFPLTPYLMRPYPRRDGLSSDKKIYNYRLGRARRIIENTFGILTAQWRIYRKIMIAKVETIEKIVQATVVLHNWLRKQHVENSKTLTIHDIIDEEENDGTVRPGEWRNMVDIENSALRNISSSSTHTFSRAAGAIRNNLKDYFDEEGAISWQFTHIYK